MNVVSPGNSKLGKLPNVSLVPGKDCVNCASCIKTCYALKAYRAYPSVKKNWTENSELLRSNPDEYFRVVRDQIAKKQPRLFRIHVAGDFMSADHLSRWIAVCQEFPKVRFLAFTKSFDFLPRHSELPDNLSIVASMFPGMTPPKRKGYSIAYAGDPADYTGTHKKRAQEAVYCPGNCETCGVCWDLGKKGLDVHFPFH